MADACTRSAQPRRWGGDDLRLGMTLYQGPESPCPREPRQPCERYGLTDDHRQQLR